MKYVNEALSEQKKKQQSPGEDDKSILYNDLDTESSDIDKEYEINKQVFQKLDSLIKRDELYLSADLSREDLLYKEALIYSLRFIFQQNQIHHKFLLKAPL